MYIKIIICLHTYNSWEPCTEEDVNFMLSVKKSNATYFLHIGVNVVQYNSCQVKWCVLESKTRVTLKFSNAVIMCLVSSVMFDKSHIISCNTHTHTSINWITHFCFSSWPSGVMSHESWCLQWPCVGRRHQWLWEKKIKRHQFSADVLP